MGITTLHTNSSLSSSTSTPSPLLRLPPSLLPQVPPASTRTITSSTTLPSTLTTIPSNTTLTLTPTNSTSTSAFPTSLPLNISLLTNTTLTISPSTLPQNTTQPTSLGSTSASPPYRFVPCEDDIPLEWRGHWTDKSQLEQMKAFFYILGLFGVGVVFVVVCSSFYY